MKYLGLIFCFLGCLSVFFNGVLLAEKTTNTKYKVTRFFWIIFSQAGLILCIGSFVFIVYKTFGIPL